jgi:hypothetical protein
MGIYLVENLGEYILIGFFQNSALTTKETQFVVIQRSKDMKKKKFSPSSKGYFTL